MAVGDKRIGGRFLVLRALSFWHPNLSEERNAGVGQGQPAQNSKPTRSFVIALYLCLSGDLANVAHATFPGLDKVTQAAPGLEYLLPYAGQAEKVVGGRQGTVLRFDHQPGDHPGAPPN